ncbi:hypothetical protein [Streptomyces lavendulae]
MALLALATPAGTAHAANGFLVIDGTEHEDPSGCYRLGDFAPSKVANHTDDTVWVWSGTNCDGHGTQRITPGETAIGRGRSVYVE